jgi:hypothetical protein
VFLSASGVYVADLYLSDNPLPYTGSIAVVALAGLTWSRPLPRDAAPWTRHALLSGLALLAWVLTLGEREDLFTEALTASACAAIGLGVLGRTARLRRWANLPTIVFTVLVIAVTATQVGHRGLFDGPPDIPARASAAFFPAMTVIMLGLATNAALTSRGALRWAGAGLIPLLVLAFNVLPAVLADDRFAPPPRDFPPVDVSIFISREPLQAYVDPVLTLRDISAYPEPTVEPTPVEVVAGAPVDDIRVTPHPGPAFGAAFLLLGLAAIATSLFPYRE